MSKYGQAKMLKLKLENIPSQNHRYRHGDWTDLIYTFYVFSNYTDSSCSSVFLCYSTEMWFKANSAETGQLAVAPSQHLFNGLEEIHSQIKQARRKKLKKNIHTHTHARQLKICSPGLSNKKDSLFIYSRIAAPHFMTTRRLSKCVWVQLHGCSLTCEAQSWKMRTIWNLLFKD